MKNYDRNNYDPLRYVDLSFIYLYAQIHNEEEMFKFCPIKNTL